MQNWAVSKKCVGFNVYFSILVRLIVKYHDMCNVIIVHFKCLGSRHFVKEMTIQTILLIYNMIFRKTNLKPFLK